MKASRQTYNGGMNKDLSKSKFPNNVYYDALNFRLLTEDGLSTGSIENIKGNLHLVTIPSVTNNGVDTFTCNSLNYTYTNTDLQSIPNQSNHQIIGWGKIRDKIILFTTNDTSTTGGVGIIWQLTYNNETLSPTIVPIYINNLNFSTKYPIESPCIGIYENDLIQRVYWTDNFNMLRTFNIVNTSSFDVSIETIDVLPIINHSKIILQDIIYGGSVKSGVYQFAYRLKTEDGCQTKISPFSNLYNIIESSETSANFWYHDKGTTTSEVEYNGGTIDVNTGKSVVLKVDNLDDNYDTIELIAIQRVDSTISPNKITVVEEAAIPSSGSVTFVYSNNENSSYTITLQELIAMTSEIETCKTISTKDNRLFPANYKTTNYNNLSFDTRAYRFNRRGTMYLEDHETGDLVISSSWSNWYDMIPETHDAINKYNDENPETNPDWRGNDQYIYQTDGTTLGGEGQYVKYKFTKVALNGDVRANHSNSNQTTTAPLVDSGRTTSTENLFVTNQTHPFPKAWFNYKSPYVCSLYKGYARGEIYRFGIVLVDKRGRPGFVNWIGDIKFPEFYDDDDGYGAGINTFQISDVLNTDHKLFALGIEFDITFPQSIIDNISGFYIVRCKRTNDDKTRLGTGLLLVNGNPVGGSNSDPLTYIDGTYGEGISFNLDQNIAWNWVTDFTFDSPSFHFANNFKKGDSDYLKIVGRVPNPVYLDSGDGFITDGHIWKCPIVRNPRDTVNSQNLDPFNPKKIDLAKIVEKGDVVDVSREININGNLISLKFLNVTDDKQWNGDDSIRAIGSKTLVLGLNDENGNFLRASLLIPDYMNYPTDKFMIGSYCRYLVEQYGGNTYEARANNEYIACSHYQQVTSTSKLNYKFSVFNGDVYINYYDMVKLEKNWGDAITGARFVASTDKSLDGIIFPTESTINTDLRTGHHFANKKYVDGKDYDDGTYLFDEYEYSDVFSTDDDIRKFYPKPVFVKYTEDFDNRIMNSSSKISGESVDSWRKFSSNDYMGVDGSYGEITKLTNINDQIFFVQENAFGGIIINPNVSVQGSDNITMEIGTGQVLHDKKYISTEYGSSHQHGITKSNTSLYFIDVDKKKLLSFISGAKEQKLSDIKGLHGYLKANLKGDILTNDNPLTGSGITSIYEPINNEIYFTFHDNIVDVNDPAGATTSNKFTLIYNETMQKFTGFYSHTPVIYINDGKHVFSTDSTNTKLYTHNEGQRGYFYDQTVYNSKITFIFNGNPGEEDITKILTNLEWLTEVYNSSDVEQYNNTLTSIRVYNEYQDTGTISLTPNTNVKRRLRKWRYQVGRDTLSTNKNERIRNPHSFVELKFNNNNNLKLILHDTFLKYS